MGEGFFDSIRDEAKETLDKITGEKISYKFEGKEYSLYFLKNGDLYTENKTGWQFTYKLNTSSKKRYNESVSYALNNMTGKKPPDRETIGDEVNAVYEEFYGKEKEQIINNTKSEKLGLLAEIEKDGKEIINDIEGLIDDGFFVLRMLFLQLYAKFFGEEIQSLDLRGLELLENKEFMNAVQELSGEIGCKTEDLIFVMYCESKLDPKAVNKYSNATGILQWLPSTAKGLGTTTEELLGLPAQQQLIYVYKFLDQNDRGKTLDSPQKLYASVFYPKYLEHIDQPDYILGSHVSEQNAFKIAENNPAISRYSQRKINGKKVIDGHAFNRYVEAQKREFDRKILNA